MNEQQFHHDVMSELEMYDVFDYERALQKIAIEERTKLFPMAREIVEFAAEHESQLKENGNGSLFK